MDNLLMQFKNDNGYTYRKLAKKINKILFTNNENIKVSHESVEDYAKSNNEPKRDEVTSAIAQMIGTTPKEFLESLRLNKKVG